MSNKNTIFKKVCCEKKELPTDEDGEIYLTTENDGDADEEYGGASVNTKSNTNKINTLNNLMFTLENLKNNLSNNDIPITQQVLLNTINKTSEDDTVIGTESLTPVNYNVVVEGILSKIGNEYRSIKLKVNNAINKITDIFSLIKKAFPKTKIELQIIKKRALNFKSNNAKFKDHSKFLTPSRPKSYYIGRNSFVKSGKDVLKYIDIARSIINDANDDKEDEYIEKILNISESIYKSDVVISGKIGKKASKWSDLKDKDKELVINALNETGDDILNLRINDLIYYQNPNNSYDTVMLDGVKLKVRNLTLGGFTSGTSLGEMDFYNKAKDKHDSNRNVLREELNFSSTITDITKYCEAIKNEVYLICGLVVLNKGYSDGYKSVGCKFETMSLDDIIKSCDELNKLVDSISYFRNSKYIKTRDKTLQRVKMLSDDIVKNIDDNIPFLLTNWLTSYSLKNIIGNIDNQIYVPIHHVKSTINSAINIMNDSLDKYE